MNTAIQPADGCFFGRLLKGSKLTYRNTELHFRGIGKEKIVTKDFGEHDRRSCRQHTVSAGIFGKRRRLQKGHPATIYVFVDVGFGPDNFTPVFFVPATDKRIGDGNSQAGIGLQ